MRQSDRKQSVIKEIRNNCLVQLEAFFNLNGLELVKS